MIKKKIVSLPCLYEDEVDKVAANADAQVLRGHKYLSLQVFEFRRLDTIRVDK